MYYISSVLEGRSSTGSLHKVPKYETVGSQAMLATWSYRVMDPKLMGFGFRLYLQCLHVVKVCNCGSSSHVSYSVLRVMDPRLVGSGFRF